MLPPTTRPPTGRARGFSLLELMVALAVLAIVAATVFARNGDTLTQLHSLERRTLGHWVLMDHLTRLRLQQLADDAPVRLGTSRERQILGGRTWELVAETKQTPHPSVRRVELSVFLVEDDEEIGPIDRLSAFVGKSL